MRLIDDYLLITTEKDVASKFLDKMLLISKENEFIFNQNKITTNFHFGYQGKDSFINSQNFQESLDFFDFIMINIILI